MPTRVVETVRTDASGGYSANPNVSALPSSYRDSVGSVQLEVDATDLSGNDQTFNFSAADASTPEQATFNLAAGTVSYSAAGDVAPTTTAVTSPASSLATNSPNAATTAPHYNIYSCNGWYDAGLYVNRKEHFMNVYTSGTVLLDQEINAAHSTGVGFSIGVGDWGLHGGVTIHSNISTGGTANYTNNLAVGNRVNTHYYKNKCSLAPVGSGTVYKHAVQVTSIRALMLDKTEIEPRDWDARACNHYTRNHVGETYWKAAGKGIDYSGGVDTPFFKVDVTAAYSTTMHLRWTIPALGEWLCGSTVAHGFGTSALGGGAQRTRATVLV